MVEVGGRSSPRRGETNAAYDRRRGVKKILTVCKFLAVILLPASTCVWSEPHVVQSGRTAAGSRTQAAIPMTLAPDLVILRGKIVTVNKDFSIVEAVAVKDGRILAVGKNSSIRPLAGAQTRILDLQGKTMLPGINDAHIHAQWFGTMMPPLALDVSPRKVKSIREIVRLVQEKAGTLKPGEWIRGSGLTLRALEEFAGDPGRYPSRKDLDAVAPDNPVCLGPFEAFAETVLWVNSKALALAGITRDTKLAGGFPGDEIVKDPATGEPIGILKGMSASSLVRKVMPAWTDEQLKQGIMGAAADLNSQGITSITEPGLGSEMIRLYSELQTEGKLTLRVCVLQAFSPRMVNDLQKLRDGMAVVGTPQGFGNEFLRMNGVKFGIDNIPNNKSAWFYEDYVGGGNGDVTWAGKDNEARAKEMSDMVAYAHRRGFQVGMHATGDRASDAVIDSFIEAEKEERKNLRHYVIHGDFIPVKNARRMIENQIGISVQPVLGAVVADLMGSVVGEERMMKFLPLKSLIDSGVHVAGGSDGPIIYPDWKKSVQFAVLRETEPAGNVINVEERITIDRAIRLVTIEGAWQDHMETVKGSIEPGKLADFCVLDQDILTVDPHKIREIKTLMTMVGGKVVYNIMK
jgi:predicted amidohydrolase YtcJ